MTIAGKQRVEAPMGDTAHDEAADRPLVAQPAE
jgi:cytochrome c oxidase cbb3-type subunit 1